MVSFLIKVYTTAIYSINQFLDKLELGINEATVTIDTAGRPVASRIPGLDVLNTTYDSRGRLSAITQGVGLNERAGNGVVGNWKWCRFLEMVSFLIT